MLSSAEAGAALLFAGMSLIGAVVGGRLARRAGLPPMTGQLAAGLAIGLVAAPLPPVTGGLLTLASQALAGAILFWIGLQLVARRTPSDRRAVLALTWPSLFGAAVLAALLHSGLLGALAPGVIAPVSGVESLLLAALLTVTSPTIVAVVSREAGAHTRLAGAGLDACLLSNAVLIGSVAVLLVITDGSRAGARPALDLGKGLAIGVALGALLARSTGRLPRGTQPALAVAALLCLRQACANDQLAVIAGAFAAGVTTGALQRDPIAALTKLEPAVPVLAMALFTTSGLLADLRALPAVAAPALALALVRAAWLRIGTRIAGTIARVAPVRRSGFAPLLPQAAASLALCGAVEVASTSAASSLSLILAVLLLNGLFAPPMLRRALRLEGGIGAACAPPYHPSAASPRRRRAKP